MNGHKIIDTIIKGSLCKARCAHDESHACVVVWSSGAAEQIEAACGQESCYRAFEEWWAKQSMVVIDMAEMASLPHKQIERAAFMAWGAARKS